jgi:iron complex outermembrane receptor protein
MQVSYSGSLQVSEITKQVDALSTSQFKFLSMLMVQLLKKALVGTATTNWQDQIYRTAVGTDHNIAFSGGC